MMGMFWREVATLNISIGYLQDHLTASFKKLGELNSWKRADFIERGGWDKMPGQEKAGYLVSRACADGLELLFEK